MLGSQALAGLSDTNPERLLDREARLRIKHAFDIQQSIRDTALARIHAGCPRKTSLTEYMAHGAAAAEWSSARMDAAFAVLSVELKEFGLIRTGTELAAIMRNELDGAANSLELSSLEKAAVWSRLLCIQDKTHCDAAAVGSDETEAARAARRKAFVLPILAKKGLSVYRWEKNAEVASKVAQRYLDGKTTPRPEQAMKLASKIDLDSLPE